MRTVLASYTAALLIAGASVAQQRLPLLAGGGSSNRRCGGSKGPNRLMIEFGEERTGERPKMATRVYVKLAPQ